MFFCYPRGPIEPRTLPVVRRCVGAYSTVQCPEVCALSFPKSYGFTRKYPTLPYFNPCPAEALPLWLSAGACLSYLPEVGLPACPAVLLVVCLPLRRTSATRVRRNSTTWEMHRRCRSHPGVGCEPRDYTRCTASAQMRLRFGSDAAQMRLRAQVRLRFVRGERGHAATQPSPQLGPASPGCNQAATLCPPGCTLEHPGLQPDGA